MSVLCVYVETVSAEMAVPKLPCARMIVPKIRSKTCTCAHMTVAELSHLRRGPNDFTYGCVISPPLYCHHVPLFNEVCCVYSFPLSEEPPQTQK